MRMIIPFFLQKEEEEEEEDEEEEKYEAHSLPFHMEGG